MIALLVIFTLMSCGGPSGSTAAKTETTKTEEAPAKKANTISFSEEDIAALKDKFIFDEASGFYYHKQWNKTFPKRRTLTADVSKTGYYYLCSNYYGKGVSHNRVSVKIDGETMNTERISIRKEAEHRTSKDKNGSKWEVNYYTNYRDNKIFDAIAKTEGPVQITFKGEDATTKYEDVNSKDIEALKECHQLSLLMRIEAAKATQ